MQLEMRSQLPTTSAIYFAIDATKTVQYIGRSTNPQQRWMSHHRYEQLSNLGGVRIAWLEVSDLELLPEIEKALIDWFQPLLNGSACLPGDGKVTVTMVLTQEEKERLKRIAEAEDRSLSYITGRFVREGLNRVEVKKD